MHQVRPTPRRAGRHGPGLSSAPSLRPALCAQVCPRHLQEDGRDLPLLSPRLQGEGERPPLPGAGATPRLRPSTLLGSPGTLSPLPSPTRPVGGPPGAPVGSWRWEREAHSCVSPPVRAAEVRGLWWLLVSCQPQEGVAAGPGGGAAATAFPLEELGKNQHFSP